MATLRWVGFREVTGTRAHKPTYDSDRLSGDGDGGDAIETEHKGRSASSDRSNSRLRVFITIGQTLSPPPVAHAV